MSFRDNLDTNTPLHNAILDNDRDKAIELIHSQDSGVNINQQSGGNTPLLLALKVGSIEIASELLKRDDVDVNLTDFRGLSPLHWACMLRQDEIIIQLISKGANPNQEASPVETPSGKVRDLISAQINPTTPLFLYQRNVWDENFFQYYSRSYTESGLYQSGFIDKDSLYIPGESTYTDLIFHIDKVCTNLKWQTNDSKKELENHNAILKTKSSTRSADIFMENFRICMKDFCDFRNAKPVSAHVVAKLSGKTPEQDSALKSSASTAAHTPASTASEELIAPLPSSSSGRQEMPENISDAIKTIRSLAQTLKNERDTSIFIYSRSTKSYKYEQLHRLADQIETRYYNGNADTWLDLISAALQDKKLVSGNINHRVKDLLTRILSEYHSSTGVKPSPKKP